jgi:hypothetical protein
MSQLLSIKPSIAAAKRELAEYEAFLQGRGFFLEREAVSFLKVRPHLCSLVQSLNPLRAPPANAYKFEFQIQGIFQADLVVGNTECQQFVLVEFEGGNENSLFGPSCTMQARDWSREMNHGFGQLIDWGWAIDDGRNTSILKNAFGCDHVAAQFLLVCGRDAGMLDQAERGRFFWRANNLIIGNKNAALETYDGLFRWLRGQIELIESWQRESGAAGPT